MFFWPAHRLAPLYQRSTRPLLFVRPSKEFYHWLVFSDNDTQRFRVMISYGKGRESFSD
jgi:hypothetical protein